MKIQVVIEATSIQEYTEAIQALAAGYTVAPSQITVDALVKPETVTAYAEAKQAVEQDVAKEEKPKATRSRKATEKPAETPKEEKNTATPETEEKTESETSDTSKQESTVSFVDVKLKAKQLANLPDGKADVKFILDKLGVKKLSDLEEDQYATFMEMAAEAEKAPKTGNDNAESSEEVENEQGSSEDTAEDKPVTLEMIRSKAKELSVAGFKEDIKVLLKDFNAAALTKIPKDKYADFYENMSNLG